MKNPCETKSRLSTVFSVAQRVELSLNMLDRVVTASKSSIANDTVIVGSDSLKFWSNEHDVDWIGASNNDLNEDLYLAMCQSAQDEFVPIYIPGDVPFAKSSDINEVIKSSNDGSGDVLVPSGQDGGTNSYLNPFPLFFKPLHGSAAKPEADYCCKDCCRSVVVNYRHSFGYHHSFEPNQRV